MRSSWPGWRQFLKDLGLRVAGTGGALLLVFILGFAGHEFDIGFLQSRGGLLVSVIVLGELIFFSLLIWAVVRGDF